MVHTRLRSNAGEATKQTTLDAHIGDKRAAEPNHEGAAKKRKSDADVDAEGDDHALERAKQDKQADMEANEKGGSEKNGEELEVAKGDEQKGKEAKETTDGKADTKNDHAESKAGAEASPAADKDGDDKAKVEDHQADEEDDKAEGKNEPEERKRHEAEAAAKKEDEVGANGAAEIEEGSTEPKHGTLESGHIYFLYRPKVEVEDPESLDDVSKFYIVLLPKSGSYATKDYHRLITVGKKQLPEQGAKHQVIWGSVQGTADDMAGFKDALGPYEYDTKTLGKRHQPGARPAARGHYILHSPRDGLADDPSTDRQRDFKLLLAYSITTPTEEEFGNVQKELHIVSEGVLAIQVKDPNVESGDNPRAVSLPIEKRAKYPEALQSNFRNRRWIPANPPTFLDYTGTELLLISTPHEIEETLGKDGDKVERDLDEAAEKERTDAFGAIKELGLSKGDTDELDIRLGNRIDSLGARLRVDLRELPAQVERDVHRQITMLHNDFQAPRWSASRQGWTR
ncbi:hypothetical protein Q5752_005656 [Cryptotrichosporon argae]